MHKEEVIKKLQHQGATGVLPTDTVYGIVARAQDKHAVSRLYRLKSREHKPGTLVAASVEQLIAMGLDGAQLLRASEFWPGPVSVVITVEPGLDYLSQGVGSLAVRVPDNSELITLLEQTGPLITSSANQPGEPPATTVAEARRYFGDQVDFYVDGGSLSDRAASTVIRFDGNAVQVLRQGAVHIRQ